MSNEHRVAATTRLIAGLTLLSRILGLARECTYGYFFGTGPLLSSFRIAFMIPNLSRRLFGEGALSAAFIPIFTRALQDRDPNHARRLAGGVLTLLTAVLAAIIVAGEIALLTADTIHPARTLQLTAILFPFMGLICLAAFLGGLLNTLGRFGVPAASPILLNGFVIAAILGGAHLAGLGPSKLIYVACGAILLAGVAQVGLQVAALRHTGFRPMLNRDWAHPDIREITAFMAPMIIGLSTVQINTMVDKLIALFFVPDGQGPAVLGYAHFLYQLPLGVFGIAVATAIFPVLAQRAACDDLHGLTRTVEGGVRLSLFLALPATVGLILIANPLVKTLFERGQFGTDGTTRVANTLVFYAAGLCAYSVQHIIVRAFYSIKDARTPVRISVAVVVLNVVLNLMLVGPLGEAGVALATAISATVQVIWSGRILYRRLPGLDTRAILASLGKTALSSAVMGITVWLIVTDGSILPMSPWPASVKMAVAVPLGCIVFAIMARALSAPELSDLLHRPTRETT